MLLQANDFRHLYEHHDVELQAGALRSMGQHRRRRRPDPPPARPAGVRDDAPADDRSDGPSSASRSGARCGSTRRGPRRTSSASSGCRADDDDGRHVPEDALDAPARRDRGAAGPARRVAGAAAGPARSGRRDDRAGAWADAAARRRARPPTCCSAATPRGASQAALEAVAAEVPWVDRADRSSGVRVHELLVQAGVAKSNERGARLLGQGAVRAGNRVLDADGLLTRIRPAQRALPAAAQGQARLRRRENF